MKACGWVCREASEWEASDLVVEGPGPCRVQFTTVYEDDVAHLSHYVRYRVTARWKGGAVVIASSLLAALAGCAMTPSLWPMAVPVGMALAYLIRGKRLMMRAVSQLVLECAEPLGMAASQEDFT